MMSAFRALRYDEHIPQLNKRAVSPDTCIREKEVVIAGTGLASDRLERVVGDRKDHDETKQIKHPHIHCG